MIKQSGDTPVPVDGKRFNDLQSLHAYLSTQGSGMEDLQVDLKRMEFKSGSLFGYRSLRISIEQLKPIAQESGAKS